MRSMGIDASSSCTGICFFDDKKLIYYDKIKPNSKTIGFREKSCEVIEQIIPIVEKYKPNIIYMEDVPEFTRTGSKGKNILAPLIALGAVNGIFYMELQHKLGYPIEFLDLMAWRQGLGFPVGGAKDSNRDCQKDRAVKFANETFGLDLYYQLGKKSVKDSDDIAEAIDLCWSKINGFYDIAIVDRLEKQRLEDIKKKAKANKQPKSKFGR